MAAQYKIDRDDVLNMHRKDGVVKSLTRKVRVTKLEGFQDYSILINALVNNSVPFFDTIDTAGNVSGKSLRMVEENIDLIDTTTVDITLKYQHVLDSYQLVYLQSQIPPDIAPPTLYGKMKTSVQQTKTNFYQQPNIIDAAFGEPPRVWTRDAAPENDVLHPGNIIDHNGFYYIYVYPAIGHMSDNNILPPDSIIRNGVIAVWRLAELGTDYFYDIGEERRQIAVGHFFPQDDQNAAGRLLYQTGEITVMQPHRTYNVKLLIQTSNPLKIETDLIGKVNIAPWLEGEIATWICSEVSFEVGEAAANNAGTYMFDIQWQHNPDTWDPTAVFFDQRTGKPPNGLREDFGRRTIRYHGRIDFEGYFGGSLFEQSP